MIRRSIFIAVTGTIGSVIAQAFGGWDNDIITLIVFMIIDYIMGLAIALMCRSEKSDKGGLSSAANWKGICKKCITLMFIIIAHRLDILMDTEYIRSAAVIGFCASELVSITENAGIIGLPLPAAITKVIDVLKDKESN